MLQYLLFMPFNQYLLIICGQIVAWRLSIVLMKVYFVIV